MTICVYVGVQAVLSATRHFQNGGRGTDSHFNSRSDILPVYELRISPGLCGLPHQPHGCDIRDVGISMAIFLDVFQEYANIFTRYLHHGKRKLPGK